jgi:hypothetical protein
MASIIYHADGSITPEVIEGFEASREARSIVHHVLGRSDPDITLRPAGMRTGTLTLVFADGAAAAAAEAALRVPQVLTLADPEVPEVAMPFVVTDGEIVQRINESRKSWTLELPFQEVTT